MAGSGVVKLALTEVQQNASKGGKRGNKDMDALDAAIKSKGKKK